MRPTSSRDGRSPVSLPSGTALSPKGRIGILTFHRCINYGSYWQARCLVEGLDGIGSEVLLLEHRSPRVERAEWRCALQPELPDLTRPGARAGYSRKIRKFLDAFEVLPCTEPFPLDDPTELDVFDLVLVGSDEVWNLNHPWYGGSSIFYGEGLPARCLASYAASFGNFTTAGLLRGRWADGLGDFSVISVRDYNSRRLIEEVLGITPALVLDPCLQFPESIEGIAPHEADAPFAVVYGHSFPAWFASAVRRWADRRGLRLLSVGYHNEFADRQWLDAGPEEFAAAMAGAEAVFTNFFHGCVVALVDEKPFACVLSDYRSNKLGDLTSMLGAEHHVIAPENAEKQMEAVLSEPLSSSINRRVAGLRRSSEAFLAHVLAPVSA
ncbi:polysaccharide pyruvyl transferase family protein [Ciceribacter thiooxidans]|uniref:Polysaccharide pyruvyl transferase family protein n=1 Tax=Ciceribacter thiooxidans TaxID=1969821 RepID=A0ABV7I2J2_9HYPH